MQQLIKYLNLITKTIINKDYYFQDRKQDYRHIFQEHFKHSKCHLLSPNLKSKIIDIPLILLQLYYTLSYCYLLQLIQKIQITGMLTNILMQLFLILGILCFYGSPLNYTVKTNITLPGNITKVYYSPEQKYLAVITNSNKMLNILDGITLKLLQNITSNAQIKCLQFCKNNKLLAIGDVGGKISIFSEGNGKFDQTPLYELTVSQGKSINAISFSLMQNLLLMSAGGVSQSIYIYQIPKEKVESLKPFVDPIGFGTIIYTMDWSPLNRWLIVGGGNSSLKGSMISYSNYTTKFTKNYTFPVSGQVNSIKFFENSNQFIMGGQFSDIQIWQIMTNSRNALIRIPLQTISKVAASSKVKYLVCQLSAATSIFTQDNKTQWVKSQDISGLVPFTLSQSGSELIIIGFPQTKLLQYSLCAQKGYYYDQEANQCSKCAIQCTQCHTTPKICYQCSKSYYLKDFQCVQCSIGCLQCNSGQICQKCNVAEHFKKVNNQCVCQQKFYLSEGKCLSCIVGCLECDDNSTCSLCDALNNFVINDTDKSCYCNKGYRQVQSICVSCGKGCNQCDNNKCLDCNSEGHWIPIQGSPNCTCDSVNKFVQKDKKCVCQDQFFENSSRMCSPCPIQCVLCSSDTNCSKCKTGFVLDETTCKCPDKTYFQPTSKTCRSCSQLPYCILCDSQTNCLSCDNITHRSPFNGKCLCSKGFYEDSNKICQVCDIIGCSECTSLSNCTVCDDKSNWESTGNGTCKCKIRYFQQQSVCKSCQRGCLRCASVDKCSLCDADRHWINTQSVCQCDKGYFQQNFACIQCILGCEICNTTQSCRQCQTDKHFIKNNHTCKCQADYYLQNKECHYCKIIGCIECSGVSNCTTCKQQFNMINGSCVCKDPFKYADSITNQCLSCINPCLRCISQQSCLQCLDGFHLDNTSCIKNTKLTLIIVISVCAGLALIIGLSVLIYRKKCKNKVKKSSINHGDYTSVLSLNS